MAEIPEQKHDPPLEEILLQKLNQKTNWDGRKMCLYQDFWCPVNALHAVLSTQKNFKAHETDVILATMPRSGTVWLKALTFTIANRHRFSSQTTPLLSTSPHVLVPFLEFQVFMEHQNPNLDQYAHPRIFSTHLPHQALPESVIEEKGCKIIYVCRNPLDHFISYRHFLLANKTEPGYEPLPIDQSVEMFCNGINLFGPFWDHVLGYWNATINCPDKMMFVKYEDVKEDPCSYIRKIAEFIGFPFDEDEEKEGVVEEIERLCSFESLKNMEKASLEKNVDQPGVRKGVYRKGEVGDWSSYLSPDMAERVRGVVEEKLRGSGLTFKTK